MRTAAAALLLLAATHGAHARDWPRTKVAAIDEKVTVDTSSPLRVMKLSDRFVCTTMDWWPNSKYSPNPTSPFPWSNASVLNADLNQPTLRAALAALSPVHLRVGGTLADQILYNVNGSIDPCTEPPVSNATDGDGWGAGCLPMSRWVELLEMCEDVGCHVVFGLNVLVGRTPAPNTTEGWTGQWDSTNAAQLLRFTADNGFQLAGVELGNEVDGAAGINAKLPAADYAAAFVELDQILDDVYSSESSPARPLLVGPDSYDTGLSTAAGHSNARPLVIGPDSNGFSDWWYPEFLGNLSLLSGGDVVLDAVTWHLYSLGSATNPDIPEEILNSTYLNGLAAKPRSHAAVVAQSIDDPSQMPSMWLGEGGGAYNSGQDGSTDTALSNFWWADSLGTFAVQAHDSFCRQALVGGNYALLNQTNAYEPNPDFYVAVMWRQLMGDVVLAASTGAGGLGGNGTQGSLRSYAHCLRPSNASVLDVRGVTRGVAMLLINLDQDAAFNVDVDLPADVTERLEWRLSSNALTSHATYLNGKVLSLSTGGSLPLPLEPERVTDSPTTLTLDKTSLSFLLFPTDEAYACEP